MGGRCGLGGGPGGEDHGERGRGRWGRVESMVRGRGGKVWFGWCGLGGVSWVVEETTVREGGERESVCVGWRS